MDGKGIPAGLAFLFATAAGLAVGNLYWAQPLLSVIAADFGADASRGGLLITATQAGYALGILLLVPLGDIRERRGLLTGVMIMTALALLFCAFAPSFSLLAAALFFLGLFTVSGQIILPMVGDLAGDKERGRIVGIVASGITAGILFSRLVSGIVADVWGWRGIYFMAAAMNLVMLAVIRLRVPEVPPRSQYDGSLREPLHITGSNSLRSQEPVIIAYGNLLAGVFSNLHRYPAMRRILFKQGMIFGIAFNLFWNALTFLLSREPFGYGTFQIGLVSLSGLTGAAAGVRLGSLEDRGLGQRWLGIFLGLGMAVMLAAAFAGGSIFAIILIAAVFSLAVQGVGVLSQARLFALSGSERSRLNTAFVVSNFLFGAAGSSLASALWNLGGWQAVTMGAAIAPGLALIAHLLKNGGKDDENEKTARP